MTQQVLGIDFSGDHTKWTPGCRRSNVWIARGVLEGSGIALQSLDAVQSLPLAGPPFAGLSAFLAGLGDAHVGIDAPFSLPARFNPDGAAAVWDRVAALTPPHRSFPSGAQLIAACAPDLPARGQKIARETERHWQERGVNVRSTVWAGPRGGAPFAAACMTLLSRHAGPVWPMRPGIGTVLVEAFPAGQLRHWRLPHTRYNGAEARARDNRRLILAGLQAHGLRLDAEHAALCEQSADALDGVVCMFAAAAVATDRIAVEPGVLAAIEGHIAIHR